MSSWVTRACACARSIFQQSMLSMNDEAYPHVLPFLAFQDAAYCIRFLWTQTYNNYKQQQTAAIHWHAISTCRLELTRLLALCGDVEITYQRLEKYSPPVIAANAAGRGASALSICSRPTYTPPDCPFHPSVFFTITGCPSILLSKLCPSHLKCSTNTPFARIWTILARLTITRQWN